LPTDVSHGLENIELTRDPDLPGVHILTVYKPRNGGRVPAAAVVLAGRDLKEMAQRLDPDRSDTLDGTGLACALAVQRERADRLEAELAPARYVSGPAGCADPEDRDCPEYVDEHGDDTGIDWCSHVLQRTATFADVRARGWLETMLLEIRGMAERDELPSAADLLEHIDNGLESLRQELVMEVAESFGGGRRAYSVADYAAAGQALDIKPYIDKDSNFKLDNFYPQPVAELSHDGKVYGLPRDISTMVTYYNADLFKAAGIPTPKELNDQGKWNWDTLLESAKKLTDASKQQYGLGFGNWWGPAWGYFTNAAGGGMFNKDRTGCGLDSAESIAGAKYAQDLYNQKLVVAGDQDSEALFSAGKVGMYFNGRWFTPGVRTNAKFAWDVAEMPQGKVKSTWLFWGPYIINSKTANPEAAWEVMKAITAPEAMAKVAEMGTNIPSRKDQSAVGAFLKSSPPANNQAFIKGTDYAVAEQALYTGNWGDFSSKVQALWDQMIAGQITPEDFGKQACEQTAGTFKK